MSYSFNVRAATMAAALIAVSVEFDKIVEQQPIHAADRDHAMASVELFSGALTEDETRDVAISVSGWISTAPEQAGVQSANFSVTVTSLAREG